MRYETIKMYWKPFALTMSEWLFYGPKLIVVENSDKIK